MHPTERAIVVSYELEASLVGDLGDTMLEESRQCQKMYDSFAFVCLSSAQMLSFPPELYSLVLCKDKECISTDAVEHSFNMLHNHISSDGVEHRLRAQTQSID